MNERMLEEEFMQRLNLVPGTGKAESAKVRWNRGFRAGMLGWKSSSINDQAYDEGYAAGQRRHDETAGRD